MIKRHNFNRLAHFVAIIDNGTITGAAAELGISKAVVSKQLQLLEDYVGTPLVLRNTRRLQPTDAGRQFYADAKSALIQANNAYERVQDQDKQPKGALRITAPVDFGMSYIAPLAAAFQDTYPEVTVHLHLTDELIDIIEDRYDLAFRIGWLSDSSNLARKLMDFEEVAVCSPKTAEKLDITEPKDLTDTPFVLAQAFSGKRVWHFTSKSKRQTVTTNTVAEINMALALKAYIAAGFSYTVLPDILIKDELETGQLVRLLPDWALRKGGVYTFTPPSRVRSNALQKFLELTHKNIGK